MPPGDVLAPSYRVDTALAVLSDQEGFVFNASSLATACRAAQVHTTFDVDTSAVLLERIADDGSSSLHACYDWRQVDLGATVYFVLSNDLDSALFDLDRAVTVFDDHIPMAITDALDRLFASARDSVRRLLQGDHDVEDWGFSAPPLWFKRTGVAPSLGVVVTIEPLPVPDPSARRFSVELASTADRFTVLPGDLEDAASSRLFNYFEDCFLGQRTVPEPFVFASPPARATVAVTATAPPTAHDGAIAASAIADEMLDAEDAAASAAAFDAAAGQADAVSVEGSTDSATPAAVPLPTLVQPSVVFGGVGSGLEAGGATSQGAIQGTDAEATNATTQIPLPTGNDTDAGIVQGAVPNAGTTSSGDPGVFMATPPTMPSFGTVAGGSLPSATNVNGAGWPSGSANSTTWNGGPMPMDQGMQSLLQYLQQHQVHGHTTATTLADGSQGAENVKAVRFILNQLAPWLHRHYGIVVMASLSALSVDSIKSLCFFPVLNDLDTADSTVSNMIMGVLGQKNKSTDLERFLRRKNNVSLDKQSGNVTKAVRRRMKSPSAVIATFQDFAKVLDKVTGGLVTRVGTADTFIEELRDWTDSILSDTFKDRDWSIAEIEELVHAINVVMYNAGCELRHAIDANRPISPAKFLAWDDKGIFHDLVLKWGLQSSEKSRCSHLEMENASLKKECQAILARLAALEATPVSAPNTPSTGQSVPWDQRADTHKVHKALEKLSFMCPKPNLKICPVTAMGKTCTHSGGAHKLAFSHDPVTFTQQQMAELTTAMGGDLASRCMKAWTK